MKRPARGSTPKQFAYATRKLTGQGDSKKELALLSGYSMTMAHHAKEKIENTEGYHNAMHALAVDSNNLLLSIISEFKARGLEEFSNKELIAAVNAVSGAWDKIQKKNEPEQSKLPAGTNPLRAIFTERTRTVQIEPTKEPVTTETKQIREAVVAGESGEKIDMDF